MNILPTISQAWVDNDATDANVRKEKENTLGVIYVAEFFFSVFHDRSCSYILSSYTSSVFVSFHHLSSS